MIDLHLHLDGSLTPEDVLLLAECSGVSLPVNNADALRPLLQVEPDCRDLGEYLEKFDLPLQVLQTEETIALSVRLLLKRLAAQGLCYAEIRFAPQLHLAKGLTQKQVASAAVRGLQAGMDESGMPAQLILCCMRGDDNLQANLETVQVAKEFLGLGVCCVDLAGNEAAYPTETFEPIFALAKQLGVPYIIHAGEAAGPKSVQQAIRLGAKRIGHGIRSVEDPALMDRLAAEQIPLELCFASNLQTKAVSSADAYPIGVFLEKGIPVTVNTDNMTVSGTCLRQEYRLLQQQFGFSMDTLQAIACNAANAAMVPPEFSETLKNQISQKLNTWLNA